MRIGLSKLNLARIGFVGSLGLAMMLVGCGSTGGNEADSAATAPKASGAKPKMEGEIEVQAFKGGYGIDFYQACADGYMKANPGVKVKLDGNPRVWEQLKPRFNSGDVPDLMFPGWGMDHWALAEEGQIMDLTDALKTPGADGKPWGETFEPALLKLGQLDGKQLTLPYYMSLNGWWINPDMFTKNGWAVPKTYGELLALSPKIKAAGIAPITFQGKYPYYMLDGMVLPWLVSIGGAEALTACQNLTPGAWNSPSMLKAAGMVVELRDKGFFQDGAVSMTHTESQQEFILGKAAMIPCGTWLSSEMKDQLKNANVKLEFILPPVVEGGKGDPGAIQVAIEPWMVPTKGKKTDLAIDFFKYMTSMQNAKKFINEKGTLMAIKGSAEGDIPEALKAPAKLFGESKDVWSIQYRHWYPAFNKEIENALTSLLTRKSTAQEFVDRCEKAAQAVRDDETISKHKL